MTGSVLLSSSPCCCNREEDIDSKNIVPKGRRRVKDSNINKSIRVIYIQKIYNEFTIRHKQEEERRILEP